MSVIVRRGTIYWIPDTAVQLPPVTNPQRKFHPRRPFLVISSDVVNADSDWPIVSGFPLSTSEEFQNEFDLDLKRGQANLPDDCCVRISLLQAIPKSKLVESIGQLDANSVEKVVALHLDYIGVL